MVIQVQRARHNHLGTKLQSVIDVQLSPRTTHYHNEDMEMQRMWGTYPLLGATEPYNAIPFYATRETHLLVLKSF